MHVKAPKKHRRQWRNLGWRAIKTHTKQQLDVERSNARGTERSDKGGGGAGRWGGIWGRQPNKKMYKTLKNATWGGVLRQPHHFPDWKVLRFFWPRKKEQRG